MNKPNRLALVVYYWPPSGGSGVQRWLFLTRYFSQHGFDISVFVPKKPRVAETDISLLEKQNPNITVVYVDGWEPLQKSTKSIAENIGVNRGVKNRVLRWIRANIFVPDARIYWARAAFKRFSEIHNKTPFDVLITSGPPHSLHLVGLKAAAQCSLPWVADFRDPWTGFFQNTSLPMMRLIRNKHKKLEHRVVSIADYTVVTAPSLEKEFSVMTNRITTLTNGFEKELFSSKNPFGLVYAGSLKTQQNPSHLWCAIAELVQEDEVFRHCFVLEIYGKVASSVRKEIYDLKIQTWVKFLGYQSKQKIDNRLPNAKALLLLGIDMPQTRNVIHAKLFEYMAAKRPILAIGPEPSDMKQLFDTHQLGVYASFQDKETIKSTLQTWFRNEELPFKSVKIAQYQRDSIAKAYVSLIKELL